MAITPNEIVEQKFPRRFRGYDVEAVTAFKESVAARLAEVIKERNMLKSRLKSCLYQLEQLKKREEEFRHAIAAAQKLAEEMKEQARKEGDLIIEEAKLDAERIVADAHQEALQLEEKIRVLRRVQRESTFRMRSALENFLRLLDEEALPGEELDQALQDAATEMRAIQEMPVAEEEQERAPARKESGEAQPLHEAGPAAQEADKHEETAEAELSNIDIDKLWSTD